MLYLFFEVFSHSNNSKKGSAIVKSSLHTLFSIMLKMHPSKIKYIINIITSNATTMFTTYCGANIKIRKKDNGVPV